MVVASCLSFPRWAAEPGSAPCPVPRFSPPRVAIDAFPWWFWLPASPAPSCSRCFPRPWLGAGSWEEAALYLRAGGFGRGRARWQQPEGAGGADRDGGHRQEQSSAGRGIWGSGDVIFAYANQLPLTGGAALSPHPGLALPPAVGCHRGAQARSEASCRSRGPGSPWGAESKGGHRSSGGQGSGLNGPSVRVYVCACLGAACLCCSIYNPPPPAVNHGLCVLVREGAKENSPSPPPGPPPAPSRWRHGRGAGLALRGAWAGADPVPSAPR